MLQPAEMATIEELLSPADVACSTITIMADCVLYSADLSRIVERDIQNLYEMVRSCFLVHE